MIQPMLLANLGLKLRYNEMSIVNFTFETVTCNDCGKQSQKAILSSYNTEAPPPSDLSYDGSCPFCQSDNTKITGLFDEEPVGDSH